MQRLRSSTQMSLHFEIKRNICIDILAGSHTKIWCSGWSLSSWSWSARAMSSSSPTRLSCAASWPTSWIRAQTSCHT
uniref:6-phosphofructo-2-kinase/fructose-2, 6-biphosphatase 2 n=1 Tax=Molossus molossus TaxID=27622 RepID=A0A7J8CSX8_MOLMO|nr:6-phosphofructo-2-kinase/fructose-2,6-biphosphatase 2 [Molossus molossus]